MPRDAAATARSTERVRAALAQIELPSPFELDSFVDSIAQRRGRPIVLRALTAPKPDGGACGLWLRLDDADVVVYHHTNDSVRQQTIICHELAHMLLDHGSDEALPADLARRLTGSTSTPSTVVRARGYSDYSDPDEFEAELMARKIVATRPRRARRFDNAVERLLDSFS